MIQFEYLKSLEKRGYTRSDFGTYRKMINWDTFSYFEVSENEEEGDIELYIHVNFHVGDKEDVDEMLKAINEEVKYFRRICIWTKLKWI